MAKRFTATNKWEDAWFSQLTKEGKLFWIYLLDKCDNAGIWEKNFKVASFFIGEEMTEERAKELLQGKFVELENGKWFFPKFIEFQYGELRWECYPHRPVIKILSNHDLIDENYKLKNCENKGKIRVIATLQEKDKEKDKDKDSLKGGVGGNNKIIKKQDFIDELLEMFCVEFELNRGIEFDLVNRGKERDAIGAILKLYKTKNKASPKSGEETKKDFKEYFQKCLEIEENWLRNNMSPSLISSKYNEIKTAIRNGNTKNKKSRDSGVTTEQLTNSVAKAFNIGSAANN